MDYFYHASHLEAGLIRFYHHVVLRELQTSPWPPLPPPLHLQAVSSAYSKGTLQDGLSDVSFGDPGTRSAYIFLNTPCFAGATVRHFLTFLHRNPGFLRKSVSRGTLRVCCLGGGPAGEVLALAKVLETVLRQFWTGIGGPLEVEATVVDIDAGWGETVKVVVQDGWRFVDPSLVNLRLRFVRADLTQRPLDREVKGLLGSADLVTMVKFVSAVYGSKGGREKIDGMLQEIVDGMRDGCVLFYVNSSRFSCMQNVNDVISASSSHMTSIYGPLFYDVHYMPMPSRQLCFRLYGHLYGLWPPLMQCKNHVVAWQKQNFLKKCALVPHLSI